METTFVFIDSKAFMVLEAFACVQWCALYLGYVSLFSFSHLIAVW